MIVGAGQTRSLVQVVLNQIVPSRSEELLVARVKRRSCTLVGLVERGDFTVAVASCVSRPDDLGRISICCTNPTDQPLSPPAGTAVGSYTAKEEADVQTLGSLEED